MEANANMTGSFNPNSSNNQSQPTLTPPSNNNNNNTTTPNSSALPNPWGAPSVGQPNFGGMGMGGMFPPMGGGSGNAMGGMDPSQMSSMMQNPMMQQMMSQMMQDPNMIQQMSAMNPQLGAAMANPQVIYFLQ